MWVMVRRNPTPGRAEDDLGRIRRFEILGQIAQRLFSPVSKKVLSIRQFNGLAINDLVDFYGLLEIQPKMKQLDLESSIIASPKGLVSSESDGLVIVPGNVFKGSRQLAFDGNMSLACQRPSSAL